MESWVDKVVLKWSREGVKINEPAPNELIEQTERVLKFSFPTDFKEFYSVINGFKDLDWQEHMFYFWPLERIMEEYFDLQDKDFIPFCDFLLASHYIGFKRNQHGIYKLYSNLNESESIPIAPTIEEVVLLINSSSDLIY
ncbi:SMI1/KNR4 family protein [Mucilaginibacter sp. McL0603]|uniref:SMI1/KNR4 family protein n=1 Tax=Mucilaginibacter sp. McL0603 TaxID=3415670 RepID=UPI003CFB060D